MKRYVQACFWAHLLELDLRLVTALVFQRLIVVIVIVVILSFLIVLLGVGSGCCLSSLTFGFGFGFSFGLGFGFALGIGLRTCWGCRRGKLFAMEKFTFVSKLAGSLGPKDTVACVVKIAVWITAACFSEVISADSAIGLARG